jgi:hypothetical protein
MAGCFKKPDRSLYGAFVDLALARDQLDGRVALAKVVGDVREFHQHQLGGGGAELLVPGPVHGFDAHAGTEVSTVEMHATRRSV